LALGLSEPAPLAEVVKFCPKNLAAKSVAVLFACG
jgi:hypothetical protein